MITKEGRIATSIEDMHIGDDVTLEFHDGKAIAKINQKKKSKKI